MTTGRINQVNGAVVETVHFVLRETDDPERPSVRSRVGRESPLRSHRGRRGSASHPRPTDEVRLEIRYAPHRSASRSPPSEEPRPAVAGGPRPPSFNPREPRSRSIAATGSASLQTPGFRKNTRPRRETCKDASSSRCLLSRTRTDTRAGRDYRSAGVSRHLRYPTPKHRSSGTTPALAHDRPSSVPSPSPLMTPWPESRRASHLRRSRYPTSVGSKLPRLLRSGHVTTSAPIPMHAYGSPGATTATIARERVRGFNTRVTKPGTLRAEEIRVSLHPTTCVQPDSEEIANRRTEIPRIASHQEHHHQREDKTEFQRATSVRYGETHVQQHPPSSLD